MQGQLFNFLHQAGVHLAQRKSFFAVRHSISNIIVFFMVSLIFLNQVYLV